MSHEHTHPRYRVLHDIKARHNTSRIGYVTVPYNHLVGLFGEPLPGDGRTTTAKWIIETKAGIGTLYDYSIDDRTTPVEAITDWHVGGKDEATYRAIIDIVEGSWLMTKQKYVQKQPMSEERYAALLHAYFSNTGSGYAV